MHGEQDTVDVNRPRPPWVRSIFGGVLMGLAMLVPGVSGGTMILVVGLYDEFVRSIAELTRFRWTRRNVSFMGVVVGVAVIAIALLAGTVREAVSEHRVAMYSLFIGLTLGGTPIVCKLIRRASVASVGGAVLGIALMAVIASSNVSRPDDSVEGHAATGGEFVIHSDYARDVASGALGMSAMVLPGISGAYMVLIMGRYETILGAIDAMKEYAVSMGASGDPGEFLAVVIPTGLGAALSLVLLSNLLKWLLHKHEKPTLGFLLGILLGSVLGIWPFEAATPLADYGWGFLIAGAGFLCTAMIAKICA